MENPTTPIHHQHQSSIPPAKLHTAHPGCPDSLNCLADSDSKPRDTFATIIRCAILSTPSKRMTLNCIYNAIEEKYPYYRDAGPGWKNTVRHVLSTSQQFEKSRRPITEPGKGGYWSVNESRSKADNPRTRRTNRTLARKELIVQEHPPAIWTPAQQHSLQVKQSFAFHPAFGGTYAGGKQEFPYIRSLPPPGSEQLPEVDGRFSPHIPPPSHPAPIAQFQEHPNYQVVQPMSQISHLPTFSQPGSMLYTYDKPPERPGWLTEVSWSNAPVGNVAAHARQ